MTDPAPRSPVSALVASFLLTDLVGYSKGTVKDQYAAKSAFSDILRRNLALLRSRDYRVKDTGDGALIAFLASPEHALYMALAITRDFETAAATAGFPSNRLRTGLNVGTVRQTIDVEAQPNFVGDGINDTKRVMDAAVPGQIVASRSFFEGVACLDAAYAALFSHLGVVRDKHDREHDLYAVAMDAAVLDNLHHDLAAGAPALDAMPPSVAPGAPAATIPGMAAGAPSPRRRAAWLAPLVGVVVVGAGALWWTQRSTAPVVGPGVVTTTASRPAVGAPAAEPPPSTGPSTAASAPVAPTTAPTAATVQLRDSSAGMPSAPATVVPDARNDASARPRPERVPQRPTALPPERSRVGDVHPVAPSVAERPPTPRSTATAPTDTAPPIGGDKTARCSRIIEKAALGEPLSESEKRSLETICR